MNHEPISILLNPAAGRGRAAKCAAEIVEILQSFGVRSKLVRSSAAGDLERLASEIAASQASQLIVAGGDGSVHEVVNGILKVGGKTALGVIPIGTGNDFAKASDTSLNWKDANHVTDASQISRLFKRSLFLFGRQADRATVLGR